MALVDIERVAAYLGVDADANRDRLAFLLDAATARAEGYCGRSFEKRRYTEYQDIKPGTGIVYTRETPLVELHSLTDDAQVGARAITIANDVHWDFDDYKPTGKIELWNTEGYFVSGSRALKIVYTAGYEPGTCPADLAEALCELVATKWEGTEALTRASQNIDGAQVTWRSDEIPPQTGETLARYKRWWGAV